MLPAADLAGVRQEARPGPEDRPAGARRLVNSVSTATASNVLRLTDITEHPAAEGKLHLCAIKDINSGRIVGSFTDSEMTASLAMTGCATPSPRGHRPARLCPGQSVPLDRVRRTITTNGLIGSMGRVGACGDNAATESFVAQLQRNVLDRQRWTTREDLRPAILTWIQKTDHRRQRRLGRLTPIESETPTHAVIAP